jgi:hypothetical protein
MSSAEKSSFGFIQSIGELVAISTMLHSTSVLRLVGDLKRSDLECLEDR